MSNPNSIQGGRWDTFFRRKFNLKGGPNTPELAAEIIPTIPLPFQLEDHFILQERLMWSRWNPGAVAGEFARAYILNPLNSGHLIIIDRVFIQNIGSSSFLSLVGGVLLSDPTTPARVRDGRWGRPSANLPGVGITQQGNSPVRQANDHLLISSTFEGYIEFPMVLSPTNPDMLLFEALNANQAIQANVFWRELVLEPSASG